MISFFDLYKYGRFGNQLFHIASTIGIAKKNNLNFGFPEWKESIHFKNQLPKLDRYMIELSRKTPNDFRKAANVVKMSFDYQEMKIQDRQILTGCMQSWKYFQDSESIIRHYFEMNEIEKLGKLVSESIGLHFRGGDFGGVYFPRCTKEYYVKALSLLPHLPVYVFSDEIETIKQMLSGIKRTFYFVETGNYIYDFYYMRQCEHFISSNGTYSWWACWLGDHPDKRVIAPEKWFNKEFFYTAKDIYYPGWEVI